MPRPDPEPTQLDRDLADLKLLEIARHYREVLDEAARKGSSLLDVLRTLIGMEQTARQQRALERRLRQARLPKQKTLADYDFTFPKRIPKTAVVRLFDGRGRQLAQSLGGGVAVHCKRNSSFFIAYVNACLPFHQRQIPIECALETGFVEHHGMESLRQAAHFFKRALCDFADLAQLGSYFGAFRRLIAGPAQHSADCGQNLPKLIVQLAGDMAQCGFLG